MTGELQDVLEQRFDCCDITQLLEYMVESGLISPKRLKYYLVKDAYYKRLKANEPCTSIKYDLAVDYDLEFNVVKHIIYTYKHIRP